MDFHQLELAELAPDLGARGTFSGKITGAGSLEKPDIQVQDLGILMAILLHEIEITLREQAGD